MLSIEKRVHFIQSISVRMIIFCYQSIIDGLDFNDNSPAYITLIGHAILVPRISVHI
jgi:hypothetical protein